MFTLEIHCRPLQQTVQEDPDSLLKYPSPDRASAPERGIGGGKENNRCDVTFLEFLLVMIWSYLVRSRNQSSCPHVTVLIDGVKTHSCKH